VHPALPPPQSASPRNVGLPLALSIVTAISFGNLVPQALRPSRTAGSGVLPSHRFIRFLVEALNRFAVRSFAAQRKLGYFYRIATLETLGVEPRSYHPQMKPLHAYVTLSCREGGTSDQVILPYPASSFSICYAVQVR
jgi:hypothetical protein